MSNEVEDGMGFSGLAPEPKERRFYREPAKTEYSIEVAQMDAVGRLGVAIKRIAEKDAEIERLVAERDAADHALQEISLMLGGTDEWSDQHNMIADVKRQVQELHKPVARPYDEWHEDIGPVLWWKFPIEEPPYVGTPNDLGFAIKVEITEPTGKQALNPVLVGGWPGYHTHWTPITAAPRL